MPSHPDVFSLASGASRILETRARNVSAMAEVDSTSKKPKIVTEKAVCKSVQRTRYVAATSMNDILETARATNLWNDDQYRKIFQQMSSILNRS